ncbi:MAG: ABC transporter ATP-binding protein [Chloroflexi bacterium]|nr:ABC transporter ATP-binding protein [Chloroflexota bacterium]
MLELRGITKRFGEMAALREVSFAVGRGEIVALLGPSGSGKSTLLNVVAGLEAADAGQVLWKGEDLAGTPPHQRGFGLMFQDFALFPHRNVAGNVGFGLEMAGMEAAQRKQRVMEMLALVGLAGFEARDVGQLSGGEQQRVALARALAPQPRLLMLDEPLGSLDRGLRERLLGELAEILKQSGQTSLYVTHDQEEAYAIADRMVLLNAGRVAQIGAPENLYRRPASAFVAEFLGLDNLFEGEVVAKDGGRVLRSALGEFTVDGGTELGKVRWLLRPDALRLDGRGAAKVGGTVSATHFRGNTTLLEVEAAGERVRLEVPGGAERPKVGEAVELSFDAAEAVQVFGREGADG